MKKAGFSPTLGLIVTALNSRTENLIQYNTFSYNQTYTIASNGYVLVDNSSFAGLHILAANITSWGTASGAWGLAWGRNNSLYIIGTAGVTVSSPSVTIVYLNS